VAPYSDLGYKRDTALLRWDIARREVTPPASGPTLRMRDIETIDSELRLVAALRRAARERGGPLPSIDVADALLDERRELGERATPNTNVHQTAPQAHRVPAGLLVSDLFPSAADYPLTQADERVLMPARHGIGQPAQLDGKFAQMLAQRRDSHEATIVLRPTGGMRQGACVSWKLLVCWYPAGLPQTGTVSVTCVVPARVLGSQVKWFCEAPGTMLPSVHSTSTVASIVHFPLTNRAWPKGLPLETTKAHPSPQGMKYQSLVRD
jgi:hypothetical protein